MAEHKNIQNTQANLDLQGESWVDREFSYPNRTIRLATSFSGIGAIEYAFKRLNLNVEIIFAGDIDANCKKAYFANYKISEEQWHTDIHNLDARPYKGKIDLFVGGAPCQAFSIVGEQRGFDTETPYFLCLDEMNLAPVEQYFAEYLSVIESRKSHEDGTVTTDPILEKADEEWYFNLTASLTSNEDIRKQFNEEGICIPQNLIVVGTVNMDETTFSFSRKVLDRAMTIEMNEVDLHGGLTERNEQIGKLGKTELIGYAVEGVDVYAANKDVCETVLTYLDAVNTVLEGTPFKVAYRTRNEFLLYVVNNLPYNKGENEEELSQGYVVARALDEITSMKVLSRIEGDDTKVSDKFLESLSKAIEEGLKAVSGDDNTVKSISLAKLKEMKDKLVSGYTSFWS